MSQSWNYGKSASRQWLVDRANHDSDECLVWPFSTARGGYGSFQYLGVHHYAHRYMCELKHGPSPSDTHEAAHGCGNSSCVNPRHISWKTPTENKMDCRLHGTDVKHRTGNVGKVTREQAAEIRSLKDTKTLKELSEQFGLSQSGIANICTGRRQARPSKVQHWTLEQDAMMREAIERGAKHREIAELIGKSAQAVALRAARLGIASKWRDTFFVVSAATERNDG
jgi:hypothetical protein